MLASNLKRRKPVKRQNGKTFINPFGKNRNAKVHAQITWTSSLCFFIWMWRCVGGSRGWKWEHYGVLGIMLENTEVSGDFHWECHGEREKFYSRGCAFRRWFHVLDAIEIWKPMLILRCHRI